MLGLLLLPFFLVGPFVMIGLIVRAFLKSDPQSLFLLVLLLIMEVFAGYLVFTIGFNEFSRVSGYWKSWTIALMASFVVCPFALGWEAYKRGWLNRWIYPEKKTRKRKRKVPG